MRIFDSKPVLRWLTPAAFVLVIAGGGLVASNASAEDTPKPRTAEQLLVDLQNVKPDGMSGTVVQTANLGIPDIPGAGGSGTSEFTGLLSGTHKLRVWYSSPDKSRVALLGDLQESDVITNGSDVWTWSSKDHKATHRTIDKADRPEAGVRKADPNAPKTPEEAAAWALKAIDPTTQVTTDRNVTVAGNKAYELVLRPKDAGSTVTQVRIAIDGDTKVPLRVQVFGTKDTLALEVGYSEVSFNRPTDDSFTFNPPADTKVTEVAPPERKAPTKAQQEQAKDRAAQAEAATKTVGSGWTTVVVAKLPADADQSNAQLKDFLKNLQPTPAGAPAGKLLVGTAFSAVLTDDGRVAVGAVTPELLYKALEK